MNDNFKYSNFETMVSNGRYSLSFGDMSFDDMASTSLVKASVKLRNDLIEYLLVWITKWKNIFRLIYCISSHFQISDSFLMFSSIIIILIIYISIYYCHIVILNYIYQKVYEQ